MGYRIALDLERNVKVFAPKINLQLMSVNCKQKLYPSLFLPKSKQLSKQLFHAHKIHYAMAKNKGFSMTKNKYEA